MRFDLVRVRILVVTTFLLLASSWAFAAGSGRIVGSLETASHLPVVGAEVSLDGASPLGVTDSAGRFAFDGVAAGRHIVTFRLGALEASFDGVEVPDGGELRLDRRVDWPLAVTESVTVSAPSRRAQRLLDAPAAVTALTSDEIEAAAPSGQVAALLATTPGVELTQGGLWDVNLNVRGFNSSLNRRIAVRIDGRDPSIPLLGSQEWANGSLPLDDFESVELVRGAGSALYGAGAYGGVLAITTKAPADFPGGMIRVTGGELGTSRVDLRTATPLGGGWHLGFNGGFERGDDFSESRNVSVEYAGVPKEKVPLRFDQDRIGWASLRLDRELEGGRFTVEGGISGYEGPVLVAGLGRVQQTGDRRLFARFDWRKEGLSLSGDWLRRTAEDMLALNSGLGLWDDSDRWHLEGKASGDLWNGRVRLVGGASWTAEKIDTANAAGVQTLLFEKVDAHQEGVWGLADVGIVGEELRLHLAARYDRSTQWDDQTSPRAMLVWHPTGKSVVRVGWAKGFMAPSYVDQGLFVQVAPPANLSAIEDQLKPYLDGASLGFSSVPRVAAGNETLKVEKVEGWELGGGAFVHEKVWLSLDAFQNRSDDFVTDLLPQISAAGRLNPNYGPYEPPVEMSEEGMALLRSLVPPQLTNAPDGSPALVLFSYTNAGEVDSKGIELGARVNLAEGLLFDAQYTRFDFDVRSSQPGDKLLPNAPEEQYGAGLTWNHGPLAASVTWRRVEGFDWAAGAFVGRVPTYDNVNLSASCRLPEHYRVGVSVTNLANERHIEMFGGDLLGRRALAWVGCNW